MADENLRSIYSPADETVEQLNDLNRANQLRAQTTRQSLDAACTRLGDASAPFVDPLDAGGLPAGPALAPAPVPTPYYPLPQRTTHGGPFGPVVRAKLLAAALAKDTRWP
jgi:hypothetical protein